MRINSVYFTPQPCSVVTDVVRNIHRRILVVVAFVKAIFFKYQLEPIAISVTRENSSKSLAHCSSKTEQSSLKSPGSLRNSTEKLNSHFIKSSSSIRKSQEDEITNYNDEESDSTTQQQTSKIVSICYKNLLTSEGIIDKSFMQDFSQEVEKKLKGDTVKQVDLSKTPLSTVSGDRILLYFSNYYQTFQHIAMSNELASDQPNFQKNDYIVLLLRMANPKEFVPIFNNVQQMPITVAEKLGHGQNTQKAKLVAEWY